MYCIRGATIPQVRIVPHSTFLTRHLCSMSMNAQLRGGGVFNERPEAQKMGNHKFGNYPERFLQLQLQTRLELN